MRYLRIYILSLLFCPTLFGQISFYKAYTDQGYDVGEGIVQLADSSYLLTGSSGSFTSSSQAFILKIDSLGNRLWSKNYGGPETDRGRRIFNVPNDGIYVVGQTNSFGPNFFDAYFFKTDPQGNLIYQRNFGSPSYENIHDAIQLKDTSFILVGETYDSPNGTENLYMLRVNRFGNIMWEQNIGSEQKDVARGITLLNDTTAIVVGEYYVPDSLTQKAMIMGLHINGTVLWRKTYGNQGKYVLNDVTIENNEIRCVGYNQTNLSVTGNNSLFRMITNQNGDFPGLATEINQGDYSVDCIVHYGSDPNDYYYAIRITNNPAIPTYTDGSDIYIYKYGANMFYNGLAFIPSYTGEDVPNEMIPTSDGGAIMVGSNESPFIGGKNVLLVKIGPNDNFTYSYTNPSTETLVSIGDEKQKFDLKLYPNPVKDWLHIESEKDLDELEISLFSAEGKQLPLPKIENGNLLNVRELNPGFYFLNIAGKVFKFSKY